MMTVEGMDLAVLGHSDTVQVPWDQPDMDLVWEHRAGRNHFARLQVVKAVNQKEEDNSFPAVGHLLEVDMRSDVLLLPSFCYNYHQNSGSGLDVVNEKERDVVKPGLFWLTDEGQRSYVVKTLAPTAGKRFLRSKLM